MAEENPGVTPPVPTTPGVTPPVPPVETVTLPKATVDQLTKDAARASGNQRKADLYDKTFGKGGHFKPVPLATPPSPEDLKAAGQEEDRKAEKGLLGLALDPIYREVLDKDPTLRDLLTKNPLAVLPIFAPDALDADDAVSLVKDVLEKRKAPPATPPTSPAPATPPVGAINANDKPVNEAVELARKIPNTERAVAGMIGARLKENAGKK